LIDIGANLTNPAFDADLPAVIDRAARAGVERIIVTGTDLESSAAAVELCSSYAPRLYCTVGVHPHDAANATGGWLEELEHLAQSPFVRAIGETGLDFNRNYSPHPAQHAVFGAQLELAGRLSRPVFVHDRDTGAAVADHLARHRAQLTAVIVHCFTGDAAQLARYLELDCHIGITGWICDERRGFELQRLVVRIPDDRLLIETDAPYLLPRTLAPRPKSRRNEPAYLIWVARAIAHLRGQSVEEVSRITSDNARRVFALD
jgi:TatD DNase family protein